MNKIKPGIAFGEHVRTERISRGKTREGFTKRFSMRSYLLPVLLFLFFGLLLVKLIGLQFFEGKYYRNLSDANRLSTTIIHAPRGVIFDRNGTPLVLNTPGFRKVIVDNSGQVKTEFVSQDQALSMIAKGEKDLQIDSLREYPYTDAFSHVVGYVGQISQSELTNPQFQDYQKDAIVGKMGLEQEYESVLKGTDGKSLSEIDATGKVVRKLGQTDPVPGQDITTTLDSKLQVAANNAMSGVKKGALVVTNPKGEVLALVSKPSFDPNMFTQGTNYHVATTSGYQNITQVLTDGTFQPLLNRVISGTYPPGSTFKLVVATAALEDKAIDERYTVDDTGVITIGAFSFANWYYTQYGRTEGVINVVTAIKRSNDIFFYKLADLLGVDKLSTFASQKFHLGQKLGIDLPGEASGLVPTKEWKLKTVGEQWYLGDNYHYGIGQGFLLTTPLQVNAWTQAIANSGTLYQPHLLKNQESFGKSQDKSQVMSHNFISQKSLDLIRQGMIEACSPGGVAWPLFDYKITSSHLSIDGHNIVQVASSSADMKHVVLACKTGTAEWGNGSQDPHAWITVIAPAYNPQIIVTVLSEASGEGSNVAGPIAKQVLDAWFGR